MVQALTLHTVIVFRHFFIVAAAHKSGNQQRHGFINAVAPGEGIFDVQAFSAYLIFGTVFGRNFTGHGTSAAHGCLAVSGGVYGFANIGGGAHPQHHHRKAGSDQRMLNLKGFKRHNHFYEQVYSCYNSRIVGNLIVKISH